MVGNLHMCLCHAALFVILGKRFRIDSLRVILQPAIAICVAACKTFHFIFIYKKLCQTPQRIP